MSLAARIDPWRAEGARWWAARSRREQWLLGVLAVIAMCVAVVVLAVRPLQGARATALADLRTYDTLQARILAAGPMPGVTAARRTGDVAAIVAASAPAFGIVVQGISPAGRSTRLHVAPVGYEALVHWLADLARTSDVRVDRLSIARAAPIGSVTADLVLSQ